MVVSTVLKQGAQEMKGCKGFVEKVKGVFQCRLRVQGRKKAAVAESMNDEIEKVESFVCLRDKLNAGGRCRSTMIAKIRLSG